MILIEIDESGAFDMLSILNVKISKSHSKDKDQNINNFEHLAAQIKKQIGEYKFNEIISSDEYEDLYDINSQLFGCFDQAKLEDKDSLAFRTDCMNYKRFLLKKQLQAKFFNNDVTEIKIGY